MSTLPQLVSARATAGARYAAAVTEMRAAFSDLAALERVLERRTHLIPGGKFGGTPDLIPLRHPAFAPTIDWPRLDDDIQTAVANYVAAIT